MFALRKELFLILLEIILKPRQLLTMFATLCTISTFLNSLPSFSSILPVLALRKFTPSENHCLHGYRKHENEEE